MKRRWVRWVVGVVAVSLILVAGLAALGATQPREHTVSRTVQLSATPTEVFDVLVDVDRYPCWRSGLSEVEFVQRDPLRFVEHGDNGSIAFEVEEAVAGERLVVRIDGEGQGWGGRWTSVLEPASEGTALTITEHGFVDSVVLRGLVSVMIDPEASITQFQDDLVAAQNGQPPPSAPDRCSARSHMRM